MNPCLFCNVHILPDQLQKYVLCLTQSFRVHFRFILHKLQCIIYSHLEQHHPAFLQSNPIHNISVKREKQIKTEPAICSDDIKSKTKDLSKYKPHPSNTNNLKFCLFSFWFPFTFLPILWFYIVSYRVIYGSQSSKYQHSRLTIK